VVGIFPDFDRADDKVELMDNEPDYELGLLSKADLEELDRILDDRSGGDFGAPALHGYLVASVIGPAPIAKDEILRTAFHPEQRSGVDLEDFPESAWVQEKIDEWLARIDRVFREQPRAFIMLVYQPKLREGDTTPDPQAWCRGFLEGMERHQDRWNSFLKSRHGFGILAPILLSADGGLWEIEDVPNPFTDLNLTPDQFCEVLQVSILGIESFWRRFSQDPSSVQMIPEPARNEPCWCGSGKKYKHCCGQVA
jgi:uncharacterized protein